MYPGIGRPAYTVKQTIYNLSATSLLFVSFTFHIFVSQCFLDTPQKLMKDWEVQDWGKTLVDEREGLGIKVGMIHRNFSSHMKEIFNVCSRRFLYSQMGS